MMVGKRCWKQEAAFAVCVAMAAVFCVGCALNRGYASVGMDEGKEMILSGGYLVVDVRTEEEYQKGHIPGALLLPVEDIREGCVDSLPDKNQDILVYCWTGRRAEDAAALLADLGYRHVRNIGGLVDWTGDMEGDAEAAPEAEADAEAQANAEADTGAEAQAEADTNAEAISGA